MHFLMLLNNSYKLTSKYIILEDNEFKHHVYISYKRSKYQEGQMNISHAIK